MTETVSRPESRSTQAGFTLIEILVALAIFASSAVLLARALNATSAGSARVFQRGLLESAAISKMDALLAGTEPRARGEIESLAGARWQVRRSPIRGLAGLPPMERLDLVIVHESLEGMRPIRLWAIVPREGDR